MKKYFNNSNLNKKIIRNKNIKEISFIKSNLDKVDFKNCKLEKCDFWEANLYHTNFNNSRLKNCIFTDTDLRKTFFLNSILIDSNLSHTNLKGVNFQSAQFTNVNLRDAIFDNQTKWPNNFNPKDYGAIKEFKKEKLITKKKILRKKIINKIVYALTQGKGYYVVKNYFNKNKIRKALVIITKILNKDGNLKKNKYNFSKDKKLCQKWVANLLNLDPVFVELIQPKLAMDAFKILLGEKFICGFFEANCLMPGARGQKPHIDYPYNYMYQPGEKILFDVGKNFLFNCQTLISLHDMNKDNGATAFLESSYKLKKFPKENAVKKNKFKQITMPSGSLVIFNGLTWHTSLPNYSYNRNRFCLLGQYLPYFIKPMLDLKHTIKKSVIKNDKTLLKQLLGANLRFPEIKY